MELGRSEKVNIKYHDIFDYPLTKEELKKWKVGNKARHVKVKGGIHNKNGFYFLDGRGEIIKKRLEKEKYSEQKLQIAKRAAKVLGKIPTVLFVGITGALAMNNAGVDSDIDLMIITKANKLWTTRPVAYLLLKLNGFKIRSPGQKDERDKLCINLWIDQTALEWDKGDRNIYTAHEIAQIKKVVDKQDVYNNFVFKNKWTFDYWPNAFGFQNKRFKVQKIKPSKITLIESIFFKLQKYYMKSKLSREVVDKHRAIFHPNNWGKVVTDKVNYF